MDINGIAAQRVRWKPQLRQVGERGQRGDVTDLVFTEQEHSKVGERGQGGDVTDLVVPQVELSQVGERG